MARAKLIFGLIFACSVVCAAPQAAVAQANPTPAVTGGKVRALLIGAADYSDAVNRGGLGDLQGAGNDVYLLAETLKIRGARPSDVYIITDAPARAGWRARARPNLSEIRAGFAALITAAQPGDQVIIQMSGHGMQQPEAVVGNEPDRLDEVFLPLDMRFKTGPGARKMGVPVIEGTLTDDEIGLALSAIRAKGADVLFLADFCHSGDSTRGNTGGARTADMKLRGDMAPALPNGNSIGEITPSTTQPKGAYVGFFAAPSPIQASENAAPFWLENAPLQGILTAYTSVALRDRSLSTWLDVARRVEAYVVQHNGTVVATDVAPPPQFEGDLSTPVLLTRPSNGLGNATGSQSSNSDRVWSLTVPASNDDPPAPITRLALNAGALDGIFDGALMSLSVPTANGREKVLLHGRVTALTPTGLTLIPADGPRTAVSAWATPKDAEGFPLTTETRFIVRMVRQGTNLTYAVHISDAQEKNLGRLSRVLANLNYASSGVVKATNRAQAQMRIRVADGKVYFDAPGAPDGKGFGAIAIADLPTSPEGLSLRIRSAVESAARFHRLRGLLVDMSATPQSTQSAQTQDAAVAPKMEYFLWRARDPIAQTEACPVPEGFADGEPIPATAVAFSTLGSTAADVARLRRCDVVLARITNVDANAIDVTALVFKPDGAIEPLETQDARRVRLAPGQVGTTGYSLDAERSLQDLRDDLVLIAVRAKTGQSGPEGVPADFTFLCQASVLDAGSAKAADFVDRTGCGSQRRKRDATVRNPTESALGDLFEAAGTGNRRSAEAAPVVGQTAIIRFSWMQEASVAPSVATQGSTNNAPR